MKKMWRIARTEVLEHRRQPAMLAVLAANYLVWFVVFGALYALLEQANHQPGGLEALRHQAAAMGLDLDAAVGVSLSTYGALMFTNLPLFVAIMSGYSVLNDRSHGTLPFLMLAPLTRQQLLMGKLIGAIAIPYLLHLCLIGSTTLALRQLDLLAPFGEMLGSSGAWWFAFTLGAPASAALVGAIGTVISALSRDVRTSMQFTSFFIGLLSLGIGYALVDGLSWGLPLQAAFASACTGLAAIILMVGARIISRDLGEH